MAWNSQYSLLQITLIREFQASHGGLLNRNLELTSHFLPFSPNTLLHMDSLEYWKSQSIPSELRLSSIFYCPNNVFAFIRSFLALTRLGPLSVVTRTGNPRKLKKILTYNIQESADRLSAISWWIVLIVKNVNNATHRFSVLLLILMTTNKSWMTYHFWLIKELNHPNWALVSTPLSS